jgi:2-phosphoglycerate kinase
MDDGSGSAARTWQVLLVGGPSGTGKTAVSYRLARYYGVGITGIDDFHALLERMATPEQLPVFSPWKANPAFEQLSAAEVMTHLLDVGRIMASGLDAVIGNHLETRVPVVLEGDFIDPALAAQANFSGHRNDQRVRAVFLYEPDEQQLLTNYLLREPERGPQTKRAQVSWLHGQWLKQEAERLGLPVVAARPWSNVFERTIAAVS